MDSPFKPGTRCAFKYGYGDYKEVFVERVHKNGNFTLRGGSPQQWKPANWSGKWVAHKTGRDSWDRTSLLLWDETTDAELTAGIAEQRLRHRLWALQKRIADLRVADVSNAMLDAVEATLPAAPGKGE